MNDLDTTSPSVKISEEIRYLQAVVTVANSIAEDSALNLEKALADRRNKCKHLHIIERVEIFSNIHFVERRRKCLDCGIMQDANRFNHFTVLKDENVILESMNSDEFAVYSYPGKSHILRTCQRCGQIFNYEGTIQYFCTKCII